jgi:hypothetical protein
MKTLRIAVSFLLVLLATAATAESDSQKSFAALKTLAGSWTGKGSQGQPVQVSYRVTSGGSALMSEIQGEKEDMVSMFHPDGDRLLMTHYCEAGNQPRMVGAVSPDGKTITFNFLDATNLTAAQPGHMGHLVVTLVDANHHTEAWEFTNKDGSKMHEVFDLQRKN